MDGATASVAVVASRAEAELIVGMLRSHGLRAAVSADDAGGQYPQLQVEGVRVLVAPSDGGGTKVTNRPDHTCTSCIAWNEGEPRKGMGRAPRPWPVTRISRR